MRKLSIKPSSFFRVLASTERSQVAEMVLSPGGSTGGPGNKHSNSDQWLYVVSGKGKAIVDGEEQVIDEGDLLLIEAGEGHEIINEGNEPLETFNIYAPSAY